MIQRIVIHICASMLAAAAGCAPRAPVTPTEKSATAKPSTSVRPDQAIDALEAFLRRQDLDRPIRAQAMFRLAALKDDLARDTQDPSASLNLTPSIEIYTQIIRDFSDLDLIPSIHYFLGHALVDSQRIDDGQFVFRSLVCQNHFHFVPPTDARAAFSVSRLPQDHEATFWTAWERRHPKPLDRVPTSANSVTNDEMAFVNPYPDDCIPIGSGNPRNEALKYIGEVWWRIGDHHFEQMDPFGGPYNLNRAVAAYRHAVRLANGRVRSLAMYKLAWTYFKQQRYAAAVDQFIKLLRVVDTERLKTGDSGVDFRKEAHTYIAGALTYVDFQGPGADDPYITREDTLDTENDPRIAEQKMHVAIDRIRDAKIVPQGETWTADIYAALILEFRELLQFRNMIETSQLFLTQWPSDARSTDIQRGIDQARVRLGQP